MLDETPIQAALRYATNQRIALQRFLDDGRLPAHNNILGNSARGCRLGMALARCLGKRSRNLKWTRSSEPKAGWPKL